MSAARRPGECTRGAVPRGFGADAQIGRIFVFRDLELAPPRLESMLAAEPASGRWVATEPETSPASLGDDEALSCFLWSLLADRTC
jgi:hypothetical protein